jgi:hypothetical protein
MFGGRLSSSKCFQQWLEVHRRIYGNEKSRKVEPVDMKLEVVVLGVSDVDRAKAFYENLGWRLDADFATSTSCS